MSLMPSVIPPGLLDQAQAAVDLAQSTRRLHARRTKRGSRQREADLRTALDRLKSAMRPLRTQIARFPYGPQTDAAERNRQAIYAASEAIQRERRKLWKMQARIR
jgi:hypothetical protein